jgi:L,D-transpeptidase catalytic domain
MKTLPVSIGKLFFLSLFVLLLPMLAAAKNANNSRKKHHQLHFIAKNTEKRLIALEAAELYTEMQLKDSGLNENALQYALLGYHRLLKRHILQKTTILSVCDFSQPSSAKRMYVLDLQNRRVLYRTYVAHGMGSGREYANSFSNVPDSYKSSLGFYVTRDTYVGSNGLSLRISGVEKGFNDKAHARAIVIHGANYVSERVLHKYGLMGTTFGCPAVPEEMASQIIPVLKNGTCFFIFYPSKRYLYASKMLNG